MLGAHRLRPADPGRAVCRQEGHEVGHHRHRPHAGPAAAVRDAEGLVQIQVAHVAAKFARCRHAHQRIHVRAVDINAPAVLVHERAQLLHAHLEHTVGAGVGNHHRRQIRAVFLALGFEVVHVDVAHRIAFGDHHRHAHHPRAGRIRAVCTFRNQADVSPALAARLVEGLDDEQPRIFTLAAGVGLQAHAGITGGLRQPGAELIVHRPVAGELLLRRKGVHVRKLRPGDGDHLAGGVELHRAAAERDHAAVERQVLVAQGPDVAQHFRFAVVAVEHRVREEAAGAAQCLRDHRLDALVESRHLGQRLPGLGEQRPQRADVVARGGFVQRDAGHRVAPLTKAAQVHAGGDGALRNGSGVGAGVDAQRIEGRGAAQRDAHVAQALRQQGRVAGHTLRDALQARRPVVHRVHACDDRQQHLRCADVGGGFFTTNVLLAGLQRQPVSRVAMGVDADAHQAARQRTF